MGLFFLLFLRSWVRFRVYNAMFTIDILKSDYVSSSFSIWLVIRILISKAIEVAAALMAFCTFKGSELFLVVAVEARFDALRWFILHSHFYFKTEGTIKCYFSRRYFF